MCSELKQWLFLVKVLLRNSRALEKMGAKAKMHKAKNWESLGSDDLQKLLEVARRLCLVVLSSRAFEVMAKSYQSHGTGMLIITFGNREPPLCIVEARAPFSPYLSASQLAKLRLHLSEGKTFGLSMRLRRCHICKQHNWQLKKIIT